MPGKCLWKGEKNVYAGFLIYTHLIQDHTGAGKQKLVQR